MTATLLPTMHGYVHGVVSLDPVTIQCDGCGITTRCGERGLLGMFDAFREFRLGSDLRLCRDCRKTQTGAQR